MLSAWGRGKGSNKYVRGRLPQQGSTSGVGRGAACSFRCGRNTWVRGRGQEDPPVDIRSSSRLGSGHGAAVNQRSEGGQSGKADCLARIGRPQGGNFGGFPVATVPSSSLLVSGRTVNRVKAACGEGLHTEPAASAKVAPTAQVSMAISGYKRKRANQLLRITSSLGPGSASSYPQAQRTRCPAAVSQPHLVRVGQRKLIRKTTGPDTDNANPSHRSVFTWKRGTPTPARRQMAVLSSRRRLSIGPKGQITRTPARALSGRRSVVHRSSLLQSSFGSRRSLHQAVLTSQPQGGLVNRSLTRPSLPQKQRAISEVARISRNARQMPPHKLVRINGQVYAVTRKAGRRTLVRQAGLRKATVSTVVASQTEGRQGRVSTEPARRDARERQVQNLQRTVRPAADRRQLSSHKLLRINGHLYTVSHKSGKRALVGQAGGCLTRSNIEARQGERKKPSISSPQVPSSSSSRNAGWARTWRRNDSHLPSGRTQFPNRVLVSRSYCAVYCRMGVCGGKEKGTCKLVHDKSRVSVCPAWLQGRCTRQSCPLQHRRCLDVMPVCMFFLQGTCSQADCPYLHVNLDPSAPVCKDFMRGCCLNGAKCGKKHMTARMIQGARVANVSNVSQMTQVHHLKRRREDMAGTMKRKRRGAVASVQGSAGSSLSDLQSVVPSFLQVDFT